MIPWLQTASGIAYDLLEPDPATITLPDTAHALSQICRYTGHSKTFYSVAQHLVLGTRALRARAASHEIQVAFFGHDMHEAVTGDVASPIKKAIGQAWHDFERRHELAFRGRFRMPRDMPRDVKAMDLAMLESERRALMEPSPRERPIVEPVENLVIYPWIPAVARQEFHMEAARLGVL